MTISAETHDRIDRAVRQQAIQWALPGSIALRLGLIEVPEVKPAIKVAFKVINLHHLLDSEKLIPHAGVFLDEINGKTSGVLFRLATIPLNPREKELVAQWLYDYRDSVRDSIHGFKKIVGKMGTIFFPKSNTPPLKHV